MPSPSTLFRKRLAPCAPASSCCRACGGTRYAADPFGGSDLVPCPWCGPAPDDVELARHLDAAREAVLAALDAIPAEDVNRRARVGLILETLAAIMPPNHRCPDCGGVVNNYPDCTCRSCGRVCLPF